MRTPRGERPRREPVYRGVVAAGTALFGALDLTVRAEGVRRVPASGPVVLAANHVSFPDFLFVGDAVRRRRLVRFLCRHDVWDGHPLVARAMTAMHHVPVDRTAPAAALLAARRLLQRGEAVCLFPEAGIPAAYVVRALMPGAVALARETGAPLLPVTTWGGQRLWPQKRTVEEPLPRPVLARGRVVDVVVHPALDVGRAPDHGPDDRAALEAATRRLGHVLHDGVEALQRRPEHRPRPGEWAPWYPAHLGGHAVDRATGHVLDAMPRSAVRPSWGPPPHAAHPSHR